MSQSVQVTSVNSSFSLVIDTIAPDKSISHRSAMFAMLASGKTVIRNFLRAEDTLNTLHIVEQLGGKLHDDGTVITIESNGIHESDEVLDCGNSGTGMRLFCGLLSSANGHFILTGDSYLKRRPMRRVTQPLRSIGARIDGRSEGEYAPLSIRGAKLDAFDYNSPIASAQVKSAMILAALFAKAPSTFSEPHLSRDHTERMLKAMGASITTESLTTRINPLKGLLEPLNITIPADPSSAFFFAVAAAITPDAAVTIKGVTLNPTRIEAFHALKRMGAQIEYKEIENRYEPIGDIMVRYAPLKAIDVSENIAWLIDELPALAIAMAQASGVSRVKNAKELRVKESDRITSVMRGLQACGIVCEEFEDGYTITGGAFTDATVDSCGDHRIAMSFSLVGLLKRVMITDVECVNTSFPNFYTLLGQIAKVE